MFLPSSRPRRRVLCIHKSPSSSRRRAALETRDHQILPPCLIASLAATTICRCQKVWLSTKPSVQFGQLTRLATVQKIVQDILATEPGMTFAKDSRDLLIECCVEFITLISSEANEIAEKDAKKTIACEHVKAALEELDFGEYVPAILEVAQDYKKQQQVRAPSPGRDVTGLTRSRTVRRSKPRLSKAARPRRSSSASKKICSARPPTSSTRRRRSAGTLMNYATQAARR